MYITDISQGDILIDTMNRLHRVAAKPAPDAAFVRTNIFTGTTFTTRQDMMTLKNYTELRISDIVGCIRVEKIE